LAEQRCSNVATKQHCSSPQHPANIEHAALLAQSDPHPLRTLTSFAADLEALADKLLPKRRIFLAGASGGGPYALAAAARMRGRVRGVLLISPATHPGARRAPPPAAPQPCVRSAARGLAQPPTRPGARLGRSRETDEVKRVELRQAPTRRSQRRVCLLVWQSAAWVGLWCHACMRASRGSSTPAHGPIGL
jgi:pimeloyl-ACP methyl ester carboxylesterase